MSDYLPAAALTKAQRAYLKGEKDYNPATERDIQSRIRERYYASLLDFALLAEECPIEELDEALNSGRPDDAPDDPKELAYPRGGFPAFATLIYLAHRDVEPESPERPDGWRTAMDVENGIETALVDRLGIDAEVSVEIEVERREGLASLGDKTDELADLSADQLTNLLRAGEITGDEHAQAWVKKQERGDFDDGPTDAD